MSLKDDFLLDPSVTYLNHGSFGATPRPVFEEYQRLQLELERQPVEFFQRRADALLDNARDVLAKFVNVPTETLIFVENATFAMNMVAKSIPLSAGDEVLSTTHEYGAMDYLWQYVAKKTGAVYVQASVAQPILSAEAYIEAFWQHVTPRTKVIFLSHITSPTAIIFPIAPIIARARAQGILTIVDGAHAVGQLPLDLTALDADIYTSNCHKWLCAPKGSAFLTVKKEVQHLVDPLLISWGWLPDSSFAWQNQWQGTRDLSAFLTVPKAIEYHRANQWHTVQAECHALAQYAREQITAITELEPLTPDSPEWYGQMIALPLPTLADGMAFKKRLFDEFRIEIPITEKGGQHFVRPSFQAYNTREDADRLVYALRVMLG